MTEGIAITFQFLIILVRIERHLDDLEAWIVLTPVIVRQRKIMKKRVVHFLNKVYRLIICIRKQVGHIYRNITLSKL